MSNFDVVLKIRFQVDAPDAFEAERYAEIFAGDALAYLCKEGCDPGDGFSEETGVVSGPDGFRISTLSTSPTE